MVFGCFPRSSLVLREVLVVLIDECAPLMLLHFIHCGEPRFIHVIQIQVSIELLVVFFTPHVVVWALVHAHLSSSILDSLPPVYLKCRLNSFVHTCWFWPRLCLS